MTRRAILLVDDHPVVRRGLTGLIETEADLEVCADVGTYDEALLHLESCGCDLAVVDLELAGRDGLELVKEMKRRFPDIPALVLSMHPETLYAERALRAGAAGYLCKRKLDSSVLSVIRRLLAGEKYESSELREQICPGPAAGETPTADLPRNRLSDRERTIHRLIVEGKTTLDIAEELNLSIETIVSDRRLIRSKLREAPQNEQSLIDDLRSDFLRDGQERGNAWLTRIEAAGDSGHFEVDELSREVLRWVGRGGTLGYPAISDRAHEIQILLTSPDFSAVREDTLRRLKNLSDLFGRIQPGDAPDPMGDMPVPENRGLESVEFPMEVVAGLRARRVAIMGFSDQASERLAGVLAQVGAFGRMLAPEEAVELEALREVDLIVLAAAAMPTNDDVKAALADCRTPLLLVGPSTSLAAWLSGVERYDFMVSKEPAELLLRAHRLLASPSGGGRQDPRPRASGQGVVVADQDMTISSLVAATLRNHGIPAHVATDGPEAIRLVRDRRPAAVLLDVDMPEMGGFEVLRSIRDDPETSRIPVVFLSARSQEADVLKAFALGADDYVPKPFNPLELVARLKRLLH